MCTESRAVHLLDGLGLCPAVPVSRHSRLLRKGSLFLMVTEVALFSPWSWTCTVHSWSGQGHTCWEGRAHPGEVPCSSPCCPSALVASAGGPGVPDY